MTGVLYDRIGRGYDTTRHADPSIVALLADALGGTSENVLDLGCRTGNYAIALAERGFRMYGVDPSLGMLGAAAKKRPSVNWVAANAACLPFSTASFGSVIAVNVVHHFKDDNGFGEIRRVLREKGILLIFGGLAEQIRHYWLAHYFPEAIRRSADEAMSLQRLEAIGRMSRLELVSRVAWRQPAEPIDFFLYCGKHRPELYLDPRVRAGISTFAKLADKDEMNKGLMRLARDVESGAVRELIAKSQLPYGDYSLIVMMAG
ncbi:MAG: class I SAM-dependent methyltransferase [Alphaproteobacteria bacterium]